MIFKGVIVEEGLKDKSILKDFRIVKQDIEKVTEKHRTPWISVWTVDKIEIDTEEIDLICEKIQKALDETHEWYVELNSNKYNIIIFHDKILKKRVNRF